MQEVTSDELSRFKAPALKAAKRITDFWGLSQEDADRVTGVTDLGSEGAVLDRNGLYRISVLLTVWKHVSWRFRDKGAAWVTQPNDFFSGRTPLSMLSSDDLSTAFEVRNGFDFAEMAVSEGYAVPPYPVSGYFCETEHGEAGVSFFIPRMLSSEPRADGGPGRFASDDELTLAIAETREEDVPVLSYLRDR